MPEELDLSDEEMADLMEFNRQYGEQEAQRLAIADSEKIAEKAITDTLKEVHSERNLDA